MNSQVQPRQNPRSGEVYTYEQMMLLHLPDSPNLKFVHKGRGCVVQNSHYSDEALLEAEPRWALTQWKYHRTTRESIPIFSFEPAGVIKDLHELVNVEVGLNIYGEEDPDEEYWVVPKCMPRVQFYREHPVART